MNRCRNKERDVWCLFFLIFLITGRFLVCPVPSCAEEGSAETGVLGRKTTGYADFAGAWNPKGIGILTGVDYRNSYRYSPEYGAVSAYRQIGLGLGVNPAYLQPSISAEWMPVLFLALRLSADGYYFYGLNGGLLSFSSANDPFGNSVRREREGTEESGFGTRIFVQPTLRAKIGGIIIRNQTDYGYYRFPGRGPYFLELEYDTLLKDKDRLFANRTQALADLGKGQAATLLGLFYETVRADAAHLSRKRIGILGYTEQGPHLGWFRATRYFGQAGYNLEDPNRAHEFFFVIGAGGTFDL